MRSLFVLILAIGGCTTSANPSETCTMAVCPAGGRTYKFCSASGATSCRYTGSDGTIFACKSCSDCASAAAAVSSWCSIGTTGATGSTTVGTTTVGTTTNTTGSTTSTTGSTGSTTGGTLTGCNGLLTCLRACAAGDTACENDCFNNSTSNGSALLAQAFLTCPLTMFCYTGHPNDGGVIPCTTADLDPTVAMLSPACDACYNALTATQIQTSCASDIRACQNDKP